jgi:Fic family protein
LLAKAQAKIQSNKQKKLDKIAQFAQKKQIIANEDIQKLLHISSATATRYMVKLVEQGRLARVGSPRDAKYQFVR